MQIEDLDFFCLGGIFAETVCPVSWAVGTQSEKLCREEKNILY
jgi:hypothetical protein